MENFRYYHTLSIQHSASVLAPPPSLVDLLDDDADSSDFESIQFEDKPLTALAISSKTMPSIGVCSFIQSELLKIRRDLQELIYCLDKFTQMCMNTSDTKRALASRKNVCGRKQGRRYLMSDKFSGCRRLNWQNLQPIVDEIFSDLRQLENYNKQTNDIIRRIRNVSAREFHR